MGVWQPGGEIYHAAKMSLPGFLSRPMLPLCSFFFRLLLTYLNGAIFLRSEAGMLRVRDSPLHQRLVDLVPAAEHTGSSAQPHHNL